MLDLLAPESITRGGIQSFMPRIAEFIGGLSKKHYQTCTEPMLSHLNVGTGTDVTIRELAETIQHVVGFKGDIIWDSNKPDGAPRKLMDISKIKSLDWQP